MAVAEINHITIDKGTYFEGTFNLFDPDESATVLAGLTTTYARIRKHSKSQNYEEFGKTITMATGTIKLTLTEDQTSRLTPGRNYFDVILTIYGKRVKAVKGTIMVQDSMSV